MTKPFWQQPDRKVTVGVFAGALVAIIVWIANTYWLTEKPIPVEIAMAIQTVIVFGIQYFIPNPSYDQPMQMDGPL